MPRAVDGRRSLTPRVAPDDQGAECADFVAPRQDETIIFNTFVLAQLVNEFNARMLGDELNMFRGVMNNKIFWGVIICSAAFQAIIVEFGSYLTQTAHLRSGVLTLSAPLR